jgi:hypothetical protein
MIKEIRHKISWDLEVLKKNLFQRFQINQTSKKSHGRWEDAILLNLSPSNPLSSSLSLT